MAKHRYVDFVSDKHFLYCVKHVCSSYPAVGSSGYNLKQLKHNGFDMFKLIFDMVTTGVDIETWTKGEIVRQNDKKVNNTIGEFHQMLLGGVRGWVDLGIGDDSHVDLRKADGTIFIELKNKFNTVNDDSLTSVRGKLERCVKSNGSAVAYWAYIVAKNGSSGEANWRFKGRTNSRIKKMWGSRIYEVVTGDDKALEKTINALPIALTDLAGGKRRLPKGFVAGLLKRFEIKL